MRKVVWGLLAVAGCDSDVSTLAGSMDAGAAGSDAADVGAAAPAPITSPKLGVTQATRVLSGAGSVVTQAAALNVPEGALSGATEVTVAEVEAASIAAELPAVLTPVAPATAFTPHGTTFAVPITLSLFYDAPEGALLTVLRLDDEDDRTWERVEAEFKNGVASFQTSHFSIYNVSACDPEDDPKGLCSDITTGEKALDELAPEDLKPFEQPDAGEPPADDRDAGTREEPDAALPAPEPKDAAVDAPPDAGNGSADDAGVEPSKDVDASVSAGDAGAGGGEGSDAGPLPGEVGCDWIERCAEGVACDTGLGGDAGIVPVGADGLCPAGTKPTPIKECKTEQVCTAAYCELHPDVCSPTSDAGLPPTFDGGFVATDASAPTDPSCWQKKCDVRSVCPSDASLGDAGKCYIAQRCEQLPCDLAPVCKDACYPVKRCDSAGVCKEETVCEPICNTNPECPQPTCTPYEVCEPATGCSAAELITEQYCVDVYVCAADAGVGFDAGVAEDAALVDPCSRVAECLQMQDKCAAVSEPPAACIECSAIIQRCSK